LLLTSLRAKDFFAGHRLNLGISGSFAHSVARRLVNQADCVISFGAALNLLTSSFGEFFPHVPLIHVDDRRDHIGRYCHADIALVGDARLVAEELLALLPEKAAAEKPFHDADVLKSIAQFDHRRDFEPAHTDWTVDMRSLALRIDQLLPAGRDVVMDLGNFFAIAPYVSVPSPKHFRYTDHFASIGLGLGTAIGVSVGNADLPTVLFIGDGSLMMTLGELESGARENLNLTIFVFNDHAYGAESHFLALRDRPVGTSTFPAVDFAPIAENLGIESYKIQSMTELDALGTTLKAVRGPLLVDCKINPSITAPFLTEFARLEGY